MLFYICPDNLDGVVFSQRNSIGNPVRAYMLAKGELITECEAARYRIPYDILSHMHIVEISSRQTYWKYKKRYVKK